MTGEILFAVIETAFRDRSIPLPELSMCERHKLQIALEDAARQHLLSVRVCPECEAFFEDYEEEP